MSNCSALKVKVRKTDCSLNTIKAVLFLVLYQHLDVQGPQTPLWVLQIGQSVLATSTNTALFTSARLIQCSRFSMIHSVCTQSLAQDGGSETIPSTFVVVVVRAAKRGRHRRVHGAVNPNNSQPQLSTGLTQLMWMTQSQSCTCESFCRQNVWHRSWFCADIHTKAMILDACTHLKIWKPSNRSTRL